MNPQTPNFIVPGNVLEAVVNYLASQPYKDVAVLINALQQSRQAKVEEEKQGANDGNTK